MMQREDHVPVPQFLFGPDGKKARFDSPCDIPRDYFPTLEEALAYAAKVASGERVRQEVVVADAARADSERAEFEAWKAAKAVKVANMAKARAARKPKVAEG